MALSFPPSDHGLLAWSANFLALIQATPTTYGLTSAQATAYGVTHAAYATALAACDPASRSKSAVMAKNQARANLKAVARLLTNTVNGVAAVTDAQKVALGINVRARPMPIPAPSAAPALSVVMASAWTVKIKLSDATSSAKRGKPVGVSGANVFSFIGAMPPNDMASWKFEGGTGRSVVDIVFDCALASGTKVWLTAFWFNGRKQSGPACAPVSANLPGGSVSTMAA